MLIKYNKFIFFSRAIHWVENKKQTQKDIPLFRKPLSCYMNNKDNRVRYIIMTEAGQNIGSVFGLCNKTSPMPLPK